MEWRPVTAEEMANLLLIERADLDPTSARVWEQFGAQPFLVLCIRQTVDGSMPSPEPIYAVARNGDDVLIYDDVEDEWGIGTIDTDGVLRSWGTYGKKLRWALHHLPS